VAVGAATERLLLFIGIPFAGLGTFLLALLIYSLYLKHKHPENYDTWLWWVNFLGGLAGTLTFCVPSVLALPILLAIGAQAESLWLGALFFVVGLLSAVALWLVARRQYEKRPRWQPKGE